MDKTLCWDMRFLSAFLCCAAFLPSANAQRGLPEPQIYTGACDASAAVVLDGDHFATGSDSDSLLRLYSRSHPGPPVSTVKLWTFLQVKKGAKTDIEAAARKGDRVYWMTSHGRNTAGDDSPNRHRFFATDVVTKKNKIALVPVGHPSRSLLRDLLLEPRLQPFGLKAASELPAKKRGGLNIEGLSCTPDGNLLIGFRSPLPEGRALLVPLLNPDDLIQEKPARFGNPVLLDLDGLGIRSVDYDGQKYLIIAGSPHNNARPSRLYVWRGDSSPPRWIKGVDLSSLNPESTLTFPDRQLHILSDDGNMAIDGTDCDDLKVPGEKRFRGYSIPGSLLD